MSSRSTSPDPITLPSSPLAAHSVRASSAIPLAPRSPNKFSSPSKSFLLDAGGGGATGKAGVSPWRLRVTVEPEFMREASLSPTKARRGGGARQKQRSIDAQSMAVQQKVPLRDVEQEGGSPLKQPPRRRRRATPAKVRPEENVGEEIEVRRPARERKGTPIRRHGAREKVARQDEDSEEQEGEEDRFRTTTPPSADLPRSRQQRSQILPSQAVAAPSSHPSPQHLQVPSSSFRPTSRTSAKSKDRRRSSLQPYHFRDKDGTLRTARLSQAREELDTALQDALGYSDEIFSPSDDHHHRHYEEGPQNDEDEDDEAEPDDHHQDENTVSINEDFTMVSVETLQSMKTGGGGAEGETSLVSHHRHSQGLHPGEKSGLSVSYLPSSPPKEDLPSTAANGDADGDGDDREGQGTTMEGAVLVGEMDGYTSTATRDQGRDEGGEEEVAEFEREEDGGRDDEAHEEIGGYDVMSWKPTGPAKRVDSYNHSIHENEPAKREGGIEYSLSEVESGEDDGDAHSVQHEEQDDEEEEEDEESQTQLGAWQSPPQNQQPSPINNNNNNNNEPLQPDEDDDIWYEEASRSLDQDAQEEGNKSFSKPSSSSSSSSSRHRQPNPPSSHPPTDTNDPSRDTSPNNMQDLLATNQPNKPPRAKIPRTWRRSSGMDFLYSDSPVRT
ncbi:hypothetical protein KC340_g17311, partial [Hortaea werneckii]